MQMQETRSFLARESANSIGAQSDPLDCASELASLALWHSATAFLFIYCAYANINQPEDLL
jgi:hypothetical protein